ncbi:outer membrane protein [Roseovarius dicentrarchi]|uniref:outer membrane protein n=1 Tax=Roseovarius dicentrarchi TaxID=2250573 RepID=UPI000DEAFC61|nr:porin family protein [Roseovarius dicentrarchi]
MKYLLSAAAASALMAGSAFAGNIEPAPMEPVIAPAPAPVFTSPNWTGFYAGGQLGYADIDGDGTTTPPATAFSANGDGMIGGLTVGYDYDLGDWVVGAGADYDWADITVGGPGSAVKMESVWRLKLRGGYKLGNGLLYATGGYANADTNLAGDADGYFVGAGYEHMLTQNFSLGGEVLYHEINDFSNVGAGLADYDADITTVQVRATFRF